MTYSIHAGWQFLYCERCGNDILPDEITYPDWTARVCDECVSIACESE